MEDSTQLPTEVVQLFVTIRFSASLDDLLLEIPSPATTTGAGLKQLIRAALPSALSIRRLRLIYSGRQLDDATSLAASLKLKTLAANASRSRRSDSDRYPEDENENEDKDEDESEDVNTRDKKGKEPVRNAAEPPRPKPIKTKVYIHCSVGDIVLDDAAIIEEKRLAKQLQKSAGGDEGFSTEGIYGTEAASGTDPTPTTAAAPRGFDRLLSAGFTAEDVSALRSQFLALQSMTHTPDTMPAGEELRRLEDRWMDEGSTSDGVQDSGAQGGGISNDDGDAGGGGGGGLGSGPGGLDDMVWGSVMGFFWPVGCALWLLREEGVWSWRKGLAVFAGVVINFTFGILQAID